jgi:actin-like ATPase involved in cell morphogenesis
MVRDFYGIDLGTSNSTICSIDEHGQPRPFQVGQGESYTLPSVVYYPENRDPVVGDKAKNTIIAFPSRCVQHIKREMGNPDYHRIIDDKDLKPEDVSAEILKKLVAQANKRRVENGEEPVFNVVVSIPAKFGHFERQRTIKAVELAGLNLISLVHEPTAAALSFGIKKQDNKTFIVYDLGGGTFDVNVMRVGENHLRILAKGGDLHCGGIDWDTAIVRMGLREINKESSVEILRNNERFESFLKSDEGQAMLASAESVKIDLCDPDNEGDCAFTFKYEGMLETVIINQDEFFDNTNPLVLRTIKKTEEVIQEAGIKDIEEIDEIIMVGGSSYMPQIETAIRRAFKIKSIHRQEPGLAISKGAAIFADLQEDWADTIGSESSEMAPKQGAMMSPKASPTAEATRTLEQSPTMIAKKPRSRVEVKNHPPKITIDEIGGQSYGICYADRGRYNIYNLINKSDPLVLKRVFDQFITKLPHQRFIDIDIREYDSNDKVVRESQVLSKRIAPNARLVFSHAVPVGTKIAIEISRDRNGVIQISASCVGSKIDIEIKKEA